jgi:hypothetical protein
VVDQPHVDVALTKRLDDRYTDNETPIKRLRGAMWLALGALVVEVIGFAVAAGVSS